MTLVWSLYTINVTVLYFFHITFPFPKIIVQNVNVDVYRIDANTHTPNRLRLHMNCNWKNFSHFYFEQTIKLSFFLLSLLHFSSMCVCVSVCAVYQFHLFVAFFINFSCLLLFLTAFFSFDVLFIFNVIAAFHFIILHQIYIYWNHRQIFLYSIVFIQHLLQVFFFFFSRVLLIISLYSLTSDEKQWEIWIFL